MKRFFALFLAIIMALSLTACGGGKEPVETKAPSADSGSDNPILSQDDLDDFEDALDKLDALNYVYMDYNPEVSQIAFLANNPNMVQINVFGTKVTQSQANKCLDQSIIVNYDPT